MILNERKELVKSLKSGDKFTMSWIIKDMMKNFRIYETVCIIVQMTNFASAGVCWMRSDTRTDTGSCRKALSLNMTQEACCSIANIPSVSWTPDISRSRLFYINFLGGDKIPCQRCHKTCETVQCSDDRVCRKKNGLLECICKPHCGAKLKRLGPFCGTDGRRYKHYCSLLRRNCIYHRQVDIAYFGKCRKSCKNVQCYHGDHCLQDQNGIPHCVSCFEKCPHQIPDNYSSYICGSDGQTYKNTCDLKAAICRKGQSIRIAYHGSCNVSDACTNINCPKYKKCLVDTTSRRPICTDCTHICSSTFHIPVCGTDGKTYTSYCHMQKKSCMSGVFIRTRRAGTCRDDKGRKRQRKIHRKRLRKHTYKLHGKRNDTITRTRKNYSRDRQLRSGYR